MPPPPKTLGSGAHSSHPHAAAREPAALLSLPGPSHLIWVSAESKLNPLGYNLRTKHFVAVTKQSIMF